MTADIFESILSTWNRRLSAKDRSVLLFLDNAACHPKELRHKFSQIKIVYMPANTTSELQPLDLGIIQNLKTKYRKFFLRYVLAKIEDCTSATEVAKSVDVLYAIRWISKAWEEVAKKTIMKCFRKAGILDSDLNVASGDTFSEDWDPFADVDGQLGELMVQSVSADDRCTAQEYVSSENDIPTCPNFDDETCDRDFIESIQPADNSRNDEHSDDSDDEEEMEVPPAPKLKNLRDVISSLEDVKYFMEFHGFTRESAQVHSLIDSATFANTPGKQSDI